MSEVNNNEIMENEDDLTVIDLDDETTESGKGSVAKVVVGLAAVAAVAVGGLAYKCKDKIAERRTEREIRKLEKKGYAVYKADEIEVREVEDSAEVGSEDEE